MKLTGRKSNQEKFHPKKQDYLREQSDINSK